MIDKLHNAVSMKDISPVARILSNSEFVVAKLLLERYFLDDPDVLKEFLSGLQIIPSKMHNSVFYSGKKALETLEVIADGSLDIQLDFHAEYFENLLGVDREEIREYLEEVANRQKKWERIVGESGKSGKLLHFTRGQVEAMRKIRDNADAAYDQAYDEYERSQHHSGEEKMDKYRYELSEAENRLAEMETYYREHFDYFEPRSAVSEYAKAHSTKAEARTRR